MTVVSLDKRQIDESTGRMLIRLDDLGFSPFSSVTTGSQLMGEFEDFHVGEAVLAGVDEMACCD